jgi:anthranilate phosphoribosyltransferase
MIREAIAEIVAGRSLQADEAARVMDEVMRGEATPAQIAGFAVALTMKGETPDEMVGLAKTMLANAVRIDPGAELDTCGTGGDGAHTFNISTAAAFVAAGAGVKVAKHGNRAMSSKCGSADVLEALGVRLDLQPAQVERCIREVGIGFLYAPLFHPAMKHAGAPRREVGVRTVFNVLGPLCNPASPRAQLLGVATPGLVTKMATVLGQLGCDRAIVIHGEDGLDELTLRGRTMVCEMDHGRLVSYTVTPEDFDLPADSSGAYAGGTCEENAALLLDVLSGAPGPCRDVVVMNAAAALRVAGVVPGLREGAGVAREVLDAGLARMKLEQLVSFCRSAAGVAA